MKKFNKYFEEITIKGNPGIPGEDHKDPEDKDYLRDIEDRAHRRLELTGRENPRTYGERIMNLLNQSLGMARGKESELENLAEEVILNNYSNILDGVKLDIKLVRPGTQEIKNFMEGDDDDDEKPEKIRYRRVTDPETIRKIHKSKLMNNIIQGEAKNTKHIIHTDEVKDGINRIFGNRDGQRIFQLWDEISKLADKMDWIIPIEIKSEMMERSPEGMAGAVKVEWEKKPDSTKPQKDSTSNMLDNMMSGEDFNKEDIEKFKEIIDDYSPVIRARGVDFPMLIHETVKGIYELIASVAYPGEFAPESEIKEAETVMINVSSFEDEAGDFRSGPEIASDFRDFINENPKSHNYPNMRAYVFGKMVDPKIFTSQEFLELFRGILNKSQKARQMVDKLINEIINEIKEYENWDIDNYEPEEEIELDDNMELTEPPTIEDKDDYSNWSKSKLQSEIDKALDENDFERIRILSKYIKESKRNIYSKNKKR